MKIESAELRIIKLQLLRPFETSFGIETERTIPILTLYGEGLEGYAEGVMEIRPLYREEFVAGALALLKEALLPRLLGSDLRNPQEVPDRLAMFRGNRMAKALVEMAFWDLWAKSLDQPLGRLLGGLARHIPVGVSLGIQKSLEATREQVQKHLDQGYQRIKLKIKPGWDTQPDRLYPPGIPHGRPDRGRQFGLHPGRHRRPARAGCSTGWTISSSRWPMMTSSTMPACKASCSTAICLDESILSAEDCRKALEIGAGRVINIKVARVGGHQEARRVHDVAQAFGAPVWCGGMLEGGIGRAHNIHLATLPNFTKPGDTSSSSRYWKQDIINEPLETQDGFMPVPQGPGIGVTLNRAFLEA